LDWYRVLLGLGTTMRVRVSCILGLLVVAGVTPAGAQSIRTSEPLVLAPYESALVYDGTCSAGKVLKVTGAIRGLRRKKSCVAIGEAQASLGASLQ
jgi:hypothetical protein